MKRKLLIILAALLLAAAALTARFIKYYGKACKDYATNGIKGELSAKIIAAVEESVTGSTIVEREAQKTTYDKDGNAETITVDAAYLNGAAVRTAKAVYEAVKKAESDFGIPLGNALGSDMRRRQIGRASCRERV